MKDKVKEELLKQLEKVNNRLYILDMIEERLVKMKKLAQRVVDEKLTDEEIGEITKEVRNLEEQVQLLDSEATELS